MQVPGVPAAAWHMLSGALGAPSCGIAHSPTRLSGATFSLQARAVRPAAAATIPAALGILDPAHGLCVCMDLGEEGHRKTRRGPDLILSARRHSIGWPVQDTVYIIVYYSILYYIKLLKDQPAERPQTLAPHSRAKKRLPPPRL